jgi:hypothetical protein
MLVSQVSAPSTWQNIMVTGSCCTGGSHLMVDRKEKREREREARNKIKDILSETYFLQLGPNISSTSQNCTTSHHIQACGTHFLFKL